MLVFKRRQVVALLLVVMVIVAGYLQYNYKESSISTGLNDNINTDDAVYVNKKVEKKDSLIDKNTPSKHSNDFFPQAKLDKATTRGKNKDILTKIIEDGNASKEQKDAARSKIMKITEDTEKEMKIETLIKEKGFCDVIALIGDNQQVDVMVKAQTLSDTDVAKIVDIVTRQTDVKISDIHVRSIY